eukprot:COSAG06_NODE_57889_length_279_cov_0.477778_1_plen_57_part_10
MGVSPGGGVVRAGFIKRSPRPPCRAMLKTTFGIKCPPPPPKKKKKTPPPPPPPPPAF